MSSGFNPRDRRGRHRPPNEPCHDCQAPMSWATSGAGRRIALDQGIQDVTDRVYVLIEGPKGWRLALELSVRDGLELAGEAQEVGLDVRTSHFDTCPVRLEQLRPRPRKDLE